MDRWPGPGIIITLVGDACVYAVGHTSWSQIVSWIRVGDETFGKTPLAV